MSLNTFYISHVTNFKALVICIYLLQLWCVPTFCLVESVESNELVESVEPDFINMYFTTVEFVEFQMSKKYQTGQFSQLS